jgi:hypothetical protein
MASRRGCPAPAWSVHVNAYLPLLPAFYFTASAWPLILTVNDSASLDTVPESRRCQLPVDPPERYRVGHLAADDFLGCIQGCGIGEPPSRTEELVLDYGRHDRRSHGQGSAPMSTVVLPGRP